MYLSFLKPNTGESALDLDTEKGSTTVVTILEHFCAELLAFKLSVQCTYKLSSGQ